MPCIRPCFSSFCSTVLFFVFFYCRFVNFSLEFPFELFYCFVVLLCHCFLVISHTKWGTPGRHYFWLFMITEGNYFLAYLGIFADANCKPWWKRRHHFKKVQILFTSSVSLPCQLLSTRSRMLYRSGQGPSTHQGSRLTACSRCSIYRSRSSNAVVGSITLG